MCKLEVAKNISQAHIHSDLVLVSKKPKSLESSKKSRDMSSDEIKCEGKSFSLL